MINKILKKTSKAKNQKFQSKAEQTFGKKAESQIQALLKATKKIIYSIHITEMKRAAPVAVDLQRL